jgi:quercetin dioxygenase-like cupin family protein
MKILLCSVALIALTSTAWAQDTMKMVTPDTVTWNDSAVLPKGAKGAILIGDPTKTGDVIVSRAKFPANYQIPPHTHPFAETITVLSGSVGFGTGDKVEKTGAMSKAGSFFANPAKHAHFVWTGNEEAIIEVHYIGPGGIDYVNPADDPRKK